MCIRDSLLGCLWVLKVLYPDYARDVNMRSETVEFYRTFYGCLLYTSLFETCTFALALLFSVSVVLWGIGMLADYLLVGNAAGAALYGQDVLVAPSYLEDLSWLNPLLFFAAEGGSHQFFMALHPVYYPVLGSWQLVIGWLAAHVALAALGLSLIHI